MPTIMYEDKKINMISVDKYFLVCYNYLELRKGRLISAFRQSVLWGAVPAEIIPTQPNKVMLEGDWYFLNGEVFCTRIFLRVLYFFGDTACGK